jgi:hypothetical protein
MNDPTANMVRAFEVQLGVVLAEDNLTVDHIEGLGGDETGPAVWRFYDRYGCYVTYPYAALVVVVKR